MSIQFQLVEQTAQPVLSVRTKTSVDNLPQIIGKAYQDVMDYLNEIGEVPAEAPFCAYYNLDMENLDVEMGFPVSKNLPGKNHVISNEIPAGKQVSCMYKGPYKEMEGPYDAMSQWIKDHGYEPTGVSYEYYYNNPAEVPESELLTKIVFPVK